MKATGGAWSPGQAPVYFAAMFQGSPDVHPPAVLVAVNDADGVAQLPAFLARGPVLLDSGIFNLAMGHARRHRMTMDAALALPPDQLDRWPQLRAAYIATARAYGEKLWGYIELDQGGAEVKRVTRAGLEEIGLAPIPVYHPLNDGWDYFDELASTYDRICLGNLVKASRTDRLRLLRTIWERRRAYPGLKWVHGLGLTVNEFMHAYPLESADSSSWTYQIRHAFALRATADLRVLGGLDRWSSTYRHGDPEQYVKSAVMGAAWMVDMNRQWRAHQGEAGLPFAPARLDGEEVPCPAR